MWGVWGAVIERVVTCGVVTVLDTPRVLTEASLDPQPIDKSPMDQFSSQARLCLREFDGNLPKLKSLCHQVAEMQNK